MIHRFPWLEPQHSAVLADLPHTGQPLFASELNSKNNDMVNRAGYALGEVGLPEAIPALISKLVTNHKIQVSSGAPPGQTSAAFDKNGGGGGFGVTGKAQYVDQELQNPKVLSALEKLTKQSFGYNEPAWSNWYASRQKRAIPAGRRD